MNKIERSIKIKIAEAYTLSKIFNEAWILNMGSS